MDLEKLWKEIEESQSLRYQVTPSDSGRWNENNMKELLSQIREPLP